MNVFLLFSLYVFFFFFSLVVSGAPWEGETRLLRTQHHVTLLRAPIYHPSQAKK